MEADPSEVGGLVESCSRGSEFTCLQLVKPSLDPRNVVLESSYLFIKEGL